MAKKRYRFRVSTCGYIVEDILATSANNACRLAFRKLIEQNLITKAPKTDIDSQSTFENTTVEVMEDDEDRN